MPDSLYWCMLTSGLHGETCVSDGFTARAIIEEMLLVTERAVLSGDFGPFRPCIRLPFTIETFEGSRTVKSLTGLRRLFEHMNDYYRAEGVTGMARRCLEAEFRGQDQITGLYETRLVHYGQLLERPPFVTLVELGREAMGWQVKRAQYVMENPQHNRALISGKC